MSHLYHAHVNSGREQETAAAHSKRMIPMSRVLLSKLSDPSITVATTMSSLRRILILISEPLNRSTVGLSRLDLLGRIAADILQTKTQPLLSLRHLGSPGTATR